LIAFKREIGEFVLDSGLQLRKHERFILITFGNERGEIFKNGIKLGCAHDAQILYADLANNYSQ
jgi:hypothetical protein